jgi:hypothetical protein
LGSSDPRRSGAIWRKRFLQKTGLVPAFLFSGAIALSKHVNRISIESDRAPGSSRPVTSPII